MSQVGWVRAVAWPVLIVLVVSSAAGVVAVGGLTSAPSPLHGIGAASASTPSRPATVPSSNLVVCGPSVVTLSPQGNPSGSMYPMNGNISVCNGGVLKIENLTVQFDSYTKSFCACAGALSPRYWFTINSFGHVFLYNSTITTNILQLNPYIKLNLTVNDSSTLTLADHSQLAFPGSLYVHGGSSLYLNDSAITNNPYIGNPAYNYGLPSNVTADNSYAPAISVSDSSQLVSIEGYINGTYASSLSGLSPLNETFASTQTDVTVFPFVTSSIVPATPLPYDTYNSWTAANLIFAYSNSAGVTLTSTATFTIYGTPSPAVPLTFPAGNGVLSAPLAAAFVTGTIDQGNLTGFLAALDAGSASISVASPSGSGLTLNQTSISLSPQFEYNLGISDQSTLIALDTSIDVNWQNPATAPAYASNKLMVDGSSTVYLVNSSANSYPTSLFLNTSAFVPDSTSNIYVLQFVEAQILTDVGTPVEDAELAAMPALPASANPNNVTGTNYANPVWLQANEPTLYNALNYWATAYSHAPVYTESNANGIAAIALVTQDLTSTTLPDGSGFGEYNMTVLENTLNVTSGPFKFSVRASHPNLCSWPYQPPVCTRPVLLHPAIVAPLLTADLQVLSATLDTSDAASQSSPVQYFENSSISVVLQVKDANYLLVPNGATGVPIVLYDSYGGGVNSPYNVSVASVAITTSTFQTAHSALVTETLTFTLPYSSEGAHDLVVMVDPDHTSSWPSFIGKIVQLPIISDGSPFWSQPVLGTPTVGLVNTLIVDPSTSQAVTAAVENTENNILLQATVVNDGDTVAGLGTVAVQFSIGVLNSTSGTLGWTLEGSPVLNLGTPAGTIAPGQFGTFSIEVPVPCSCQATLQANVTYTISHPGVNAPPPFTFRSDNPYSVEIVDYTSLVLKTPITELLTGAGTWSDLNPNNTEEGVHVGQAMAISMIVINEGGIGTSANATLEIFNTATERWVPVTSAESEDFSSGAKISSGATYNITVVWHVSPSTIRYDTGPREFALVITWNNGPQLPQHADVYRNVTIMPSLVSFEDVNQLPDVSGESPTSTQTWTFFGTVVFDSAPGEVVGLDVLFESQLLNVNQSYAQSLGRSNITDATNGTQFTLGFGIPQVAGGLPAGTYTVVIEALFNGQAATSTFYPTPTTIGISGASSCSGFFALCNLEFIILIVIAVAVVAVVAAFFLMGRQGKGRLVECGECGELIPDKAPACPKCGAEFEAEMVRCSRCASTIPAASTVCPECSALLLGKEGTAGPDEQTRKDYAQSIEQFRAEGRKELGDQYSEGSFWDWWKRQPTYLSYSAFKLQQAQGTRSGMAAPQASGMSGQDLYQAPPGGPGGPGGPPGAMGGAPTGGAPAARPPIRRAPQPRAPSQGAPPLGGAPPDMGGGVAPGQPSAGAGMPGGGMKSCSSCGREINSDFLVCPFCGAATR